MKTEIIIKIFLLLLGNEIITAPYISQKYGISRRTVYRYMDELTIAGIPVNSVRGGGKSGFYISEDYRKQLTEELKARL